MKKVILMISMLAASACLYAQGLTFEGVAKKLSQNQITTGKFAQVKTIAAANRNLRSSGTFVFCPDGISWKTEKPFPSSLVVTKNALIQTSPDGKQTVTDGSTNATFAGISSAVSSVFTNDTETMKKNFSIEFSDMGNGAWEMNLAPKDKTVASMLSSIVIGGKSSDTTSIESLVLLEGSGDKVTYTFTEQKYPKELSADEKAYFVVK